MDIFSRLDELKSLNDGWAEGAGKAPSAVGLNWLADAFLAHYPDDYPLPHLYPTPQGGIQAEWSLGPFEVSLEIDVENHRAHWHSLDLQTQAEESRDLNLDDVADWNWLSGQIHNKTGEAA